MKKTVIFETPPAEQSLVGVKSLDTGQWSDVRAGGRRKGERLRETERWMVRGTERRERGERQRGGRRGMDREEGERRERGRRERVREREEEEEGEGERGEREKGGRG